MKLLYVTNSCPWPPTSGTRQRNYHLIRHLSTRHEVRVVVLEGPPSACPEVPAGTEFLELDRWTRPEELPAGGWPLRRAVLANVLRPDPPPLDGLAAVPQVGAAFRGLRPLARAADAVWVSRSWWGELAVRAAWGRRIAVDYDELATLSELAHARRLRPTPHKLFALIGVAKLFAAERRLARRAWRSVVCKAEDRRFFGPNPRVFVVPNGTPARPPLPDADAEPGQLLFVGLMTYHPNQDAVTWFVRDILPRVRGLPGRPPRLDVVGQGPPESIAALASPAVRVRGFVPDLPECYRRAAVVVAPVRLGGGTRLKVLEALSYGKPLVATAEVVRGLDLRPGVDLEVADSPADFAAACQRLLGDADLRRRLGRSGRERVLGRFDWARVGGQALRVLAV